MKIVTASQMTQLDRRTIEEFGVPGERLMERAGHGVFRAAMRLLSKRNAPARNSVLLFAGRGNNGGDALVVARLLQNAAIPNLTVLLAEESDLKGDAAMNLARLKKTGGRLLVARDANHLKKLSTHECSLIVDGILGTGIRGAVKGFYAEVIEFINRLDRSALAIDIPSGINGDTGDHQGPCVRADVTVTMGLPKLGLLQGDALNFLGKLEIVDIGIPARVLEEAPGTADLLTAEEMSALLPRRKRISHKGDYGRVFVVAGSRGLTGAAAMVCSAAVRAGSGLVFLGIPASLNAILETKLTEPMTVPLDETAEGSLARTACPEVLRHLSACDCAIIGPGISTHPETAHLVQEILTNTSVPLLIDADGLNCLRGKTDLLTRCRAPLILTPHPMEMCRLTGMDAPTILAQPWQVAADFAKEHGVIVILKGAETVIADADGSLHINIAGDAGMASGGMGDVLSGIVGSLVGQGLKPVDAAKLGTFVHGVAGEMGVQQKGQLSLVASDVIGFLPRALEWIRTSRETEDLIGRSAHASFCP